MKCFKSLKYTVLVFSMLSVTAFATESINTKATSNSSALSTTHTNNHIYKTYIEATAVNKNIPKEVTIIPAIESGYKEKVSSADGINVGMWQINKHLAKDIGLTVNKSVDERQDWKKSTDAVLSYLQHNAKKHFNNNYDLSVLAYNVGTQKVKQAMIKHKTQDAQVLIKDSTMFKPATIYYFNKYLAYKNQVKKAI